MDINENVEHETINWWLNVGVSGFLEELWPLSFQGSKAKGALIIKQPTMLYNLVLLLLYIYVCGVFMYMWKQYLDSGFCLQDSLSFLDGGLRSLSAFLVVIAVVFHVIYSLGPLNYFFSEFWDVRSSARVLKSADFFHDFVFFGDNLRLIVNHLALN